MTAKEFVNSLETQVLNLRESPLNINTYDDELLKLIKYYDVSNFEIGEIYFFTEIIEDDDLFKIGKIELDELYFDTKLRKCFWLSWETQEILGWCAKDSEAFLDALSLMSNIFNKMTFEKWDDEALVWSYLNKCKNAAGGEEFIEFYRFLFGS